MTDAAGGDETLSPRCRHAAILVMIAGGAVPVALGVLRGCGGVPGRSIIITDYY
jgi:predicted membrane channel-forming protein YqfA (hemolysin III family)